MTARLKEKKIYANGKNWSFCRVFVSVSVSPAEYRERLRERERVTRGQFSFTKKIFSKKRHLLCLFALFADIHS